MAAGGWTDGFLQHLDKNELLFRRRMEAICEKYNHPFEEDIQISLADMTSDLLEANTFWPSGNSSLFESSVKSGSAKRSMQLNEDGKLENENSMITEYETSDIPSEDSKENSLMSNEEGIADVANETYNVSAKENEDLWVSEISSRSSVGVSQERVPLARIPEMETGKKYVTEVDFLLTLDESSVSCFEVKPTGKENFHVAYSPLKNGNGAKGNRIDSSKYLHNWLRASPLSSSNSEMIKKMRSFIGRHKRRLEPHAYMSTDDWFHHTKDYIYTKQNRSRELCEDTFFVKPYLEKASDSLDLNNVTLVDLYPGMIESLSRLLEFACKKRAADDIVKHYKRNIWNVNRMKLNITKEKLRDFRFMKSKCRKNTTFSNEPKSKEISPRDDLNESSRTSEGQDLRPRWNNSATAYNVASNAVSNGLKHSKSLQINSCLQPSPVKKDFCAACYGVPNALATKIERWGSPQATSSLLSVRQNASPKTTSVLMEDTYIVQSPLQTFKSWELRKDRSKKLFHMPSQQPSSVMCTIGSNSRPFIVEKVQDNIQTCNPSKPLIERNVNHRLNFVDSSVNYTSTFLSNSVDYNCFKCVPLQRRHSCSALPVNQSPVKTPLRTEDTFGELYRKLVLKKQITPLDKRRILSSRRLEAIHSSKIVDALVNSPLQKRGKRSADCYSDDDSSMSYLKRPRNVLEHFASNALHHQPSIGANFYSKQNDLLPSLNISRSVAEMYNWKSERQVPEYDNGFHSCQSHSLMHGTPSSPMIADASRKSPWRLQSCVSPRRTHDINIGVSRKLSYIGKEKPGSATYVDGFQI